ncbi:hypothetical protein B0H19DRAFT_1062735 [Mycena capillaripes]|nr:hypothetical protein B0H19DRAFT_1062735 [Mycena capillaripes]
MQLSASFLALLAVLGKSAVSATPLSKPRTTLVAKEFDICLFKGHGCDLTKYNECVSIGHGYDRGHKYGECCAVSKEDKCAHFRGPYCEFTGVFDVRSASLRPTPTNASSPTSDLPSLKYQRTLDIWR